MTVSRNDIQTLIAEIDQLLWVGGQTTETEDTNLQPRYQAVLEKARWCLGNLIRQVDVPTPPPATLMPAQQDTADAIAQAVIAQMNFQRQDWLQPMQLELETLRQQRETLQRDIHHLETHQRQMSHELLQTVMHRCSESIKQELLAVFEQVQGQLGQAIAGTPSHTANPSALQQLDWLERLRSLEQQADQLFLSLDQTFHQVFDSLEQDVHSYHQALSQKLGQIHELQHQSLLNTATDANVLPQAATPMDSTQESGSEVAWFAQPLQLGQGDPLPTLEPLMTAELVVLEEPVEQLLHMDIVESPVPEPTATDAIATDATPAMSSDQAWEAWDEYLFTQDGEDSTSLLATDAPRVLTVDTPPLEPRSPDSPEATMSQGFAVEPTPASHLAEVDAQQGLFANLSDPAQVTEPEQDWTVSETQSVGTVLFGDPVVVPQSSEPEPDGETAADETVQEVDPNGPSLEETIASLGGLLDQVSERVAEMQAEPPSEPELDEHDPQVAAGETLLATAEVTQQKVSALDHVLDSQQMQQLTADLARFEGGQTEADTVGIETVAPNLEVSESIETIAIPPKENPSSAIQLAAQVATPEPLDTPTESSTEAPGVALDEWESRDSTTIAPVIASETAPTDRPEPEALDTTVDRVPESVPTPENEREAVVLDDIELEAADFETVVAPSSPPVNPPIRQPSNSASLPTVLPVAAMPEPEPLTTPTPALDSVEKPSTIEVPAQAVYTTLSELAWDDALAEPSDSNPDLQQG